jgi:hypothetical protein
VLSFLISARAYYLAIKNRVAAVSEANFSVDNENRRIVKLASFFFEPKATDKKRVLILFSR